MSAPARIVTLSLLVSLASFARAETLTASVDNSRWQITKTPLQCTLTHFIPDFGRATFSQLAGKKPQFELISITGQPASENIQLAVHSPYWKRTAQTKIVGIFPFHRPLQPLLLTDKTVYQLLESLKKGETARFIFDTASSYNKVALLPLGFHAAYEKYLGCLKEIIPHTFEELKETVLYFESGSTLLSHEEEARLREIARFILADGKIRRINITGHADAKGDYVENMRLANERMWQVKDYLVMAYGVSPQLFSLKGAGERTPVAPNKTAEGRAKNRRVIIKLLR